MAEEYTAEQVKAINEVQRRYFNANVDIFEPPLPKGVPERLRATVEAGNLRGGERVLDVGIGTGVLTAYILKHRPLEVHGCDIAENMLRRVKKKFPRVVTHLCDIRDLSLPDDSLDVAYINGCFSNIADKAESLNNLYRLLRKKGRLVISHPMGRDFIVELKKHTPFHLDLLPDESEARELLGRHGFDVTAFLDEPTFYLVVAETRK